MIRSLHGVRERLSSNAPPERASLDDARVHPESLHEEREALRSGWVLDILSLHPIRELAGTKGVFTESLFGGWQVV